MRKNGNVPCVIYGGAEEAPVHIGISENELRKSFIHQMFIK